MNEYYKDLTENLRLKIITEYGSVAEFCRQNNLCRFTLSKAFNGRVMNVSTFMKLCSSLYGINFALAHGDNSLEMSLIDYLEVRFNDIERNFIKVLMGS